VTSADADKQQHKTTKTLLEQQEYYASFFPNSIYFEDKSASGKYQGWHGAPAQLSMHARLFNLRVLLKQD
jgi:hypothetical protein